MRALGFSVGTTAAPAWRAITYHGVGERRPFLPGGDSFSVQEGHETLALHIRRTLEADKGQDGRHDVDVLDLLIHACARANFGVVGPMEDQRNLVQFTIDT